MWEHVATENRRLLAGYAHPYSSINCFRKCFTDALSTQTTSSLDDSFTRIFIGENDLGCFQRALEPTGHETPSNPRISSQ